MEGPTAADQINRAKWLGRGYPMAFLITSVVAAACGVRAGVGATVRSRVRCGFDGERG